jgi:UDP-glucuronate 4-epimerase
MQELLGRTEVPWRNGVRRLVEARHPELLISTQLGLA